METPPPHPATHANILSIGAVFLSVSSVTLSIPSVILREAKDPCRHATASQALYFPPMPVYIALLRGVNVTGANKIKMEDLRALCTKLKLESPQTLIQSGNIVFRSSESSEPALSKKLADAIEKQFGFRPEVMLRSADELRAIVAASPFHDRKDVPPNKLLVHFFHGAPAAELKSRLTAAEAKEELHFLGRELYIYFPDGIGRSEFRPILDRVLKKTATARNWNTVTKLLQMAEVAKR